MSFLLGSFTSGMFSGFNDVQNAFLKGEEYKQQRVKTQVDQETAGDKIMQSHMTTEKMRRELEKDAQGTALKNDMMQKVGAAMGPGGNGVGSGGGGSKQLGYSDPDSSGGNTTTTGGPVSVDKIKPTDMPLPGATSATGATPGVDTVTQPASAGATPMGGGATGTPGVDTKITAPGSGGYAGNEGGTTAPQLPDNATLAGGQPVNPSGYTNTGTATPRPGPPSNAFQQPQGNNGVGGPSPHTPSYINPNTNNVMPGSGPTRPPAPPGSVSQAVPTRQPGPGLASNMSGLGPQIIAAMNPTAGPTA